MENRRKHPRIEVGLSGTINIPGTGEVPCEVLDISLGGVFLHCTVPIRIGQEILVKINFDPVMQLAAKVVREPGEMLKLMLPEKSVVRWVRGSEKAGFGAEFVGLSAEKRTTLEKLILQFQNKKKKKKKSAT